MILPNDILLRTTSDSTTVWVSQRLVCERCGVSEKELRDTCRVRYKASLRASWQAVAARDEFFLGDNPGRSWRWGRKGGQYYYDLDRIPNRRPGCYRDRLPAREELIAAVEGHNLRGSRERQSSQRRMIRDEVERSFVASDIAFYEECAVGGKAVFTPEKARQMARAAAWCRFLKRAMTRDAYRELGFATQADLLGVCAAMLAETPLEGMKIRTAEALRKKIGGLPDDPAQLAAWLVSGKYGNDNRRIIGRSQIVDHTTGEVMRMDAHQAAIMTCWLNPGGSEKETKKELWQRYAAEMEALGITPVKPSTFEHYTNAWSRKLLAARERHGAKHFRDTYRPYVPARPLEYANSLWASDGSGIVPYRYSDAQGRWRMMKLYVMMVSDVGSRCIAGYAVSRQGSHLEDGTMLRRAMRMALQHNGRAEVMDFISDNHGAYTGGESRDYLQEVCRSVRTIAPGNSQANPAEMLFRLFKRRFKSYFHLPETSWGARSLESMANPDRYDPMSLPTYAEAIERLEAAVEEWNQTPLRNGLTPSEWFRTLKNPRAGEYSARQYRRIAGEVSRRDLSCARSVLEVDRGGRKYRFDIPSDAETLALIARHTGYAPSFRAEVCWDADGADIYTPEGIYVLTCPPAPLASKSMAEATPDSLRALAYHDRKGGEFDRMIDDYATQVEAAREVLARGYGFHIHGRGTKEEYNALCESLGAAGPQRATGPESHAAAEADAEAQQREHRATEKELRAARRAEHKAARKAERETAEASVEYHRKRISNLNDYL